MATVLFTGCPKPKDPVVVSPTISSVSVANVTPSTAIINVSVSNTGGAEIQSVYVSVLGPSSVTITIGNITNGGATATLSNLLPNATYSYVASATNSAGMTGTKNDSFTTPGVAPEVTTSPATFVKGTTTTLSAVVKANNTPTTIVFEYGPTTTYGTTLTVATNIKIKNDTTVFVNLTGLTMETTYHFRAKAQNSIGLVSGSDLLFQTVKSFVSDGYEYTYKTIGAQVWMTENYRGTKFRNGDPIANVQTDAAWKVLKTPGWCDYNNDAKNGNIYGRSYNFPAVSDSRNIAPIGWHVPTKAEWAILDNSINHDAKKLRSTGTLYWSTDTGSSNETGFTALPGGSRDGISGNFLSIRSAAYFWTNTLNSVDDAWVMLIDIPNQNALLGTGFITTGYSLRLIQDSN